MGDTLNSTLNQEKYNRFIFSTVALVILMTVGISSNFATLVALAILCFTNLFSSPTITVSNLLFFYPFYNMFKFQGIGISYYNVLIIFSIFSLWRYKDKRTNFISNQKNEIIYLLFFLFIYLNIISVLFRWQLDVKPLILDLFIPIILIIVVMSKQEYIKLDVIVYSFAIGVVVAGLCGAEIIRIDNLSKYIAEIRAYRVGAVRLIRLQGLTVNPNYYSVDLNLCFAGLLILPALENRKNKIIEIVLIFFIVIMGIMTLSKSFLFGLMVNLLLILFMNKEASIAKKYIFSIIVLGTFFCLVLSNNNYIQALTSRIISSGDTFDSLTSSRSTIWVEYLKYIFTNPNILVFGLGIGSSDLTMSTGSKHACHSFYIECIYRLGIIGTTILIAILKKLVFDGISRKNLQYIPFLVLLIRAFAINLLLREAFATSLIFCFLFLMHNLNRDTLQLNGASDVHINEIK